MAEIQGSDNLGGTNQSAENDFGDFGFWFQWIEFDNSPSNLTQAGFDTLDGSIADTPPAGSNARIYNAGGTDDLDNLATNASAALLGNSGERFGLRVVTNLEVTTGGTYRFDVRSDDGMRFYVDGQQVVIDDSLHAPRTRSGSIDLDPGQHEIVVIWFERTGQNVLEVDVTGPDYPTTIQLQNANVSANSLADTVTGGEGDDVIRGGEGADSLDGGDDADSLFGGADGDTLLGGDGDDTIDGGAGDDLQTGGDGFDTFIVSAGDDTISDFNTGAGQNFDDGDQTNNDFVDLAPYYDTFFEARADLADDGLLNQSNATDSKGRNVDYGDNTALPGTIAMPGTAPADLTFDNINVACFTRGAMIATPDGERPVQTLRIGDLVVTRDGPPQTIRWIGARRLDADMLVRMPKLRPIRLETSVFGSTTPLIVSPQHRMLLLGATVELMFGEEEVLVKAVDLIGRPGVERLPAQDLEYWHFACDAHEIVYVSGAPTETLLLQEEALKGFDSEARQEIEAIFTLAGAEFGVVHQAPLLPVRPILKSFEARAMLAAR